MKSNPSVMKALSLKTRLPPGERVRNIQNLMGKIIQGQQQGEMERERKSVKKEEEKGGKKRDRFKNPLSLHHSPTKVNARILPPFEIAFPRKSHRLDQRKD